MSPKGGASREPVVLVVDDDEDVADTYSMWLESEYDVRTAYGGHEALEEINDEVNVVLLDRRMPSLPGDEVLDRIRDEDIDCMVSMLTAVNPSQDLTELEFDEYLTKPVSKEDIVSTVEELLFRDQMEEETQEYLAMKATTEAIEESASADEISSDEVESLRDAVESAETNPAVQRDAEELERLSNLSEIARSANRAVIRSDSREELGQAICQEFVDGLPYRHVIFGECTDSHDEFIPSAGVDGKLDISPVTCRSDGPLKTALDESQVIVVSSIDRMDEGLGKLNKAVVDGRISNTAIIVPVEYQNTVYGGILLFTDEDIELTERESSTLLEVGASVGNAIDSLQTRELVDTDSVVELEMDVRDNKDPFVDLSDRHRCRVQVDGIHLNSEDGIACYLTIYRQPSGEIMEFFAERKGIEKYQVVDDNGEDTLLQCRVSDSSLLLETTRSAAGLVEFFAEDGVGHLSVQFAPNVDLRSVLDTVKEEFEDIELVSKQHTETPYQSVGRFRGTVEERLTERQDEVISAAFKAGYFDWPRESTAEDVAEILDLAPPTLHEHLREGQRKLAKTYLEETDLTKTL